MTKRKPADTSLFAYTLVLSTSQYKTYLRHPKVQMLQKLLNNTLPAPVQDSAYWGQPVIQFTVCGQPAREAIRREFGWYSDKEFQIFLEPVNELIYNMEDTHSAKQYSTQQLSTKVTRYFKKKLGQESKPKQPSTPSTASPTNSTTDSKPNPSTPLRTRNSKRSASAPSSSTSPCPTRPHGTPKLDKTPNCLKLKTEGSSITKRPTRAASKGPTAIPTPAPTPDYLIQPSQSSPLNSSEFVRTFAAMESSLFFTPNEEPLGGYDFRDYDPSHLYASSSSSSHSEWRFWDNHSSGVDDNNNNNTSPKMDDEPATAPGFQELMDMMMMHD